MYIRSCASRTKKTVEMVVNISRSRAEVIGHSQDVTIDVFFSRGFFARLSQRDPRKNFFKGLLGRI